VSISAEQLRDQEALFAEAFSAPDLERVRSLYHPEVVYLSPTVRLFGWPRRIEGVERTLEFIGLIAQQEFYYDPSGSLEKLPLASRE
jgi:hypothetical protein